MSTDETISPLTGTGASEAQKANAVASVEAHGERMLRQRVRLFPQAMGVGILVGLVAVLFRWGLDSAESWRRAWLTQHVGFRDLWWIPIAIGLIGVALLLVRWLCPESTGSGIPHLKMVLEGDFRLRWLRILPVKFISGLWAIGGGLCLGREGPTIQMGAALGGMWGDLGRSSTSDRHSLLVTGASAGLAAAFNAPLAGILFVLEELRINLPDSAFFSALVASITADIVTRALMGQLPVIRTPAPPIPALVDLPFFLLLGLIAGLASGVYNVCLLRVHRWLDFRSWLLQTLKVVVAGIVVGTVGWFDPSLPGGGMPLAYRALEGDGAIDWLARTLAVRFALSIGSYAVGTAGGIFAPLLVLGGLMGLLVGKLCVVVFPEIPAESTAFAAAGMSALFAGVVRCPLTGIVLMIEMTGHYQLVIPLTVAAYTANFVADHLRIKPIYDALLEEQMRQSSAA